MMECKLPPFLSRFLNLKSDKLQFVVVSGRLDKLKFVGHSNQDSAAF